MVKNPPVSAGDARDPGSVPGSGRPPLELEMAAHSSILAWEIPWTEEPGGLQSLDCRESDVTEQLDTEQVAEQRVKLVLWEV